MLGAARTEHMTHTMREGRTMRLLLDSARREAGRTRILQVDTGARTPEMLDLARRSRLEEKEREVRDLLAELEERE